MLTHCNILFSFLFLNRIPKLFSVAFHLNSAFDNLSMVLSWGRVFSHVVDEWNSTIQEENIQISEFDLTEHCTFFLLNGCSAGQASLCSSNTQGKCTWGRLLSCYANTPPYLQCFSRKPICFFIFPPTEYLTAYAATHSSTNFLQHPVFYNWFYFYFQIPQFCLFSALQKS